MVALLNRRGERASVFWISPLNDFEQKAPTGLLPERSCLGKEASRKVVPSCAGDVTKHDVIER